MKRRAHAWIALSAFRLIDDTKAAPTLAQMLAYYLSDVWDGAWIPDTLIRDMAYGHIYKMGDRTLLGKALDKDKDWATADQAKLKKRLAGKRYCLDYVAKSTVLGEPYRTPGERGGHLPNRVIAVSHTISDMLKMGDYPISFYVRGLADDDGFKKDLSQQSIDGLSVSPNFSARQIALMFFVLSHYIADAHMPLHCDLRDAQVTGKRVLPDALHGQIEAAWEEWCPTKEDVVLHDYLQQSVDDVVTKRLPEGSPLARIGLKAQKPRYELSEPCQMKGDEWNEMVNICRVSYAVSQQWIPAPSAGKKDSLAVMQADAKAWEDVTCRIFADAVNAVARVWCGTWRRFAGA